MAALEALYTVMKQYTMFIIDVGISVEVSTSGELSLLDDKITGDNFTIRDVKEFRVRKDCEDPEVLDVEVTFTDLATATIYCI